MKLGRFADEDRARAVLPGCPRGVDAMAVLPVWPGVLWPGPLALLGVSASLTTMDPSWHCLLHD